MSLSGVRPHIQTRLLLTVHTCRPLSCCVSRSLALSSSSFFQPRRVSTLSCSLSLSTYCDTETGRDKYFLRSVSAEPHPIVSLPPVASGNQATARLTSEAILCDSHTGSSLNRAGSQSCSDRSPDQREERCVYPSLGEMRRSPDPSRPLRGNKGRPRKLV